MNIVGFPVMSDGDSGFAIVKHSQSNLKGLLWATASAGLSGAALTLTAGTIVVVGASVAGTAIAGPAPLVIAAAAITVDYFAVKFTGYCFSNSIHHFGPEYQIIRVK